MIQTQENGKKTHFGSNLGPFDPNSDCHFFFFFFKNLALSVTRFHGQISSCTIPEKTNDPILRSFNDSRTDGQTDGQTDENDFIGRCSTKVERSTRDCSKYG